MTELAFSLRDILPQEREVLLRFDDRGEGRGRPRGKVSDARGYGSNYEFGREYRMEHRREPVADERVCWRCECGMELQDVESACVRCGSTGAAEYR